jgi:hypothetical protein
LYEDAGDGFGYREGEYLISGFTARQVGPVVKVEITFKKGTLKPGKRKYKVILVNDIGSIESDWVQKNSISVKMPSKWELT